MQKQQKRIVGRAVATELTAAELAKVAGGANWEHVKFTTYDTNGGSDDTQLTDH